MVDAHLNGKEINTKDITRLIIGGQTGVDGIRFCVASTVNGEDLTDPTLGWFLQFKNKYGLGEPIALTPVYEDSLIKLPWVPGSTATQVAGRLQIQVFAAKTEVVGEVTQLVKQWVSLPAVIYIEENLNPDPITPIEPTVLDQYLVMFTSLKEAAEAAALAAAGSLVDFEKRYLGGKDSDPALDNQGEALLSGALYYNTVTEIMRLYNGTSWVVALGTAEQLGYNNEDSGLESEDVKAALDELDRNVSKVALGVVKNDLDIQDLQRNLLLENQSEAKASVSDYGIVTLPKNATGNLKMKREGLTAINCVSNSNFESGLKGSKIDESGSVSTYTLNTTSPISGTKDGRLVITTSHFGRPKILNLFQGDTPIVGDSYFFSFDYKVNSGPAGITGFWNGTGVTSLGALLTGSGRYEFIAPCNGTSWDILYMDDYLCDVQFDNLQRINLTQTFASIPDLATLKKIFPSYFADTKNVPFTGRYRGIKKNLWDGKVIGTKISELIYDSRDSYKLVHGVEQFWACDGIFGQQYTIKLEYKKESTSLGSTQILFIYSDGSTGSGGYLSNTSWTTFTATTTAGKTLVGLKQAYSNTGVTYIDKAIMVEPGILATAYENYESHDLYLTAEEGRSVPSAKDSVEVVDGKLVHVKRVSSDYTFTGSETWVQTGSAPAGYRVVAYAKTDMVQGVALALSNNKFQNDGDEITPTSSFVKSNPSGGSFNVRFCILSSVLIDVGFTDDSTGVKNWVALQYNNGTPLVIRYELVIPITTPIDSDGLIPAGASVFWEPVVADVGIYSTKFDILDTTRPISALDKLYKVDFETGVPTLITDAVVAGGGLSFTSASLTVGDLVNVLYYYATANPEGLTTAEYLNSNVVFADTANGKYYKLNPVVTNGELVSWQPVEVV